jgi:hypothetical protein
LSGWVGKADASALVQDQKLASFFGTRNMEEKHGWRQYE